MNQLIKSISGIRGTIGGSPADNLTPIDVVKFTTAYTRLIKEKHPDRAITIVVGRDARLSGTMVDDLVEGTLLGCGANVINVARMRMQVIGCFFIRKAPLTTLIFSSRGFAKGTVGKGL